MRTAPVMSLTHSMCAKFKNLNIGALGGPFKFKLCCGPDVCSVVLSYVDLAPGLGWYRANVDFHPLLHPPTEVRLLAAGVRSGPANIQKSELNYN